MPINSPSAMQTGFGLGDSLPGQVRDETEEEKKRKRMLGLAAGSPTEQAFLGAAAQFNVGGYR